MGIDVGTQSAKIIVINEEGKVLAKASSTYTPIYPKPGWAEENAEDWWIGVKEAIRKVGKRINLSEIDGIAVSGQAPTCLPVDKYGKPLRNAIIWIDGRAEKEAATLKEIIGNESSFQVSGNIIHSHLGGPKFLWFRKNEAEKYEKTWKILQSHSYIIYKLTNEAVTDYSTAGLCAPCYDYRKRDWSEEICNIMGINLEKLPRIGGAWEVAGEITGEAAAETGLRKGIEVMIGGGDYAASTLATGVIREGEASLMLGTACNLLAPVASPKYDPRLINTMHVVRDTYLVIGSAHVGGILRWFKEMFCRVEDLILSGSGLTVYQLMDDLASKIPAGSEKLIVLPYFMGGRTPIWDPHARGMIIGLTFKHTKAHIYRAILESLGYAFYNLMLIMEERGIELKSLTTVNGGARSQLWRQILADILGKNILYIKGCEGAAFGDCVLAGVGIGKFKDEEVINNWIKIETVNEPNMRNHEIYRRLSEVYTKLYENNKELFRLMGEIKPL